MYNLFLEWTRGNPLTPIG